MNIKKPRISVIIPAHKCLDTIEFALRSLDDQDFKDFDVCVVVDGKDDKLQDLLFQHKEAGTFSFTMNVIVLQKNKGASIARNEGAKATESDILFFMDADCRLYPGMLSEFSNQFDYDPTISFVYGNYRFENRTEFYSQEFDPYLLQTMNYISTMSPVLRTAFDAVGGFKDLPYFQDWSLFYRLAEKGFKGKFIKEFLFSTKLPNTDSISGNTISLKEKAGFFRKEHGIDDKKLAVTTFGAPLQAIQRAKMLNADYVGPSKDSKRAIYPVNYQFDNWLGTYIVGFYNDPISALDNHLLAAHGDKKIIHFIGTDVFQLITTHNSEALKAIRNRLSKEDVSVLVNGPRLRDELAEIGIKAKLVYTPIFNIEKYKNLNKKPEKFTVGIYYSDTNPMHGIDGHGGRSNLPLLLDIAHSMPDIHFKFFGGQAIEKNNNIEFCGRIQEENMVEFINSCDMNLRATIHDGFPQLPIQFMLCGKHALVSAPDEELKYAHKLSFEEVVDYEEAKSEIINKIYEISILPELNSEHVFGYYNALMSEDVFKNEVYKCLR